MNKSNFRSTLFLAAGFFLLLIITIVNKGTKQSEVQEIPTVTESTPDTNSPNIPKLIYPSQVLNLTNWKLTLPTGSSGNPTEIEQPKLGSFEVSPWFTIAPKGGAVSFRAAVNGATTSGSDYPRSELREMLDAKTKAGWDSEKGTHIMFLDQAITAVPVTKPDVVAGQIHDDDKDIIVIRLDYPTLHIRVDGKNVYTLDTDYSLGEKFNVKFEVKDNRTRVYYNNGTAPVYTLNENYSDAYFKVGVYTQSNCAKEKAQSLCNKDNYGEVVVYKTEVTHQ